MGSGADWFSRYKFCQPIGQGGMGTVYLAEDRANHNSPCVIKQLTNKYANPEQHAEAIRLFRREVSLLRTLCHPGIVKVLDDHVTEDGRYFLVMEYVPGKNLDIMLKTGGPFTSDHAVWLGIQCCEVLEYLHSLDPPIIYRDLKPSNLMLTPEGRIVLVDFGIARAFMPKDAATKVVSAGYSAPEQYSGKPELRSDIYSLGATLFHLLTGVRPKPLTPCSPILIDSSVHPGLDSLVRAMTAPAPGDRPVSMKAVRYELYKIYRDYYADFEPPDWNAGGDVVVQQDDSGIITGQWVTLNSKTALKAHGKLKDKMMQSSFTGEASTVWEKIKSWFTQWK